MGISFPIRHIILSGKSYSPEAKQFLARISDPGRQQKDRLATMIDGIVADGDWNRLDVLHVYAQDSQGNGLINIRKPAHNGTIVGTVTFAAYQGVTGNASTGAVNTNYTATTQAVAMSQDSDHIAAYVRNARTTAATKIICGVHETSGGNSLHIIPKLAGDLTDIQNMGPDLTTANAGNVSGHWINTRTSSTAVRLDRNGSNFGTYSSSSVEFDIPFTIYVLAMHTNVDGVFGATDDQIAAFHCGGGLDAAASARITTRINTYLTAVGANVF